MPLSLRGHQLQAQTDDALAFERILGCPSGQWRCGTLERAARSVAASAAEDRPVLRQMLEASGQRHLARLPARTAWHSRSSAR